MYWRLDFKMKFRSIFVFSLFLFHIPSSFANGFDDFLYDQSACGYSNSYSRYNKLCPGDFSEDYRLWVYGGPHVWRDNNPVNQAAKVSHYDIVRARVKKKITNPTAWDYFSYEVDYCHRISDEASTVAYVLRQKYNEQDPKHQRAKNFGLAASGLEVGLSLWAAAESVRRPRKNPISLTEVDSDGLRARLRSEPADRLEVLALRYAIEMRPCQLLFGAIAVGGIGVDKILEFWRTGLTPRLDLSEEVSESILILGVQRVMYERGWGYNEKFPNGKMDEYWRGILESFQKAIDKKADGKLTRALQREISKMGPRENITWGAIAYRHRGGYHSGWNYSSREKVARRVFERCAKAASSDQCSLVVGYAQKGDESSKWLAAVHCDGRIGGRNFEGTYGRASTSRSRAIDAATSAGVEDGFRERDCSVRTAIAADGSHKD